MYSSPLYRPPSEAKSLIVQITEGCSHNKCRFCYMYKSKQFRVKSENEIYDHINNLKLYQKNPKRVFLADGNVLCLRTELIIDILKTIKKEFPTVERISSYSGPMDLIKKSEEELNSIRREGLELIYMGVESGSDKVLNFMKKGVSKQQMIEAGRKAINSGFKLSCMIISGLGGVDNIKEHAIESAEVISLIDPQYFSLLRLVVDENSLLYSDVQEKKFILPSPSQILDENILMIENLNLSNCIFRANHISNYINLAGTLNEDKEYILENLKKMKNKDEYAQKIIDSI